MAEKKSSKAEVVMVNGKDCKGSVRYETADPNAVATNIYVSRKFMSEMPGKIKVTIEPAE